MQQFGRWRSSNRGVGSVLLLTSAALLIYLFLSPWTYIELTGGFRLGFFPALYALLLFALSFFLIFDSHRNEVPADLKSFTFKRFLIVLLTLGVCFLYFLGMVRIGFLIVTPFFMFLGVYALGLRSWRKCIIWAVAIAAIIYSAFSILGIELPPGVLSGMLPF